MVRSDIKHCSRFQQVHGNWTLSVYGNININTPPPPVFPCFKDIRSHLWQKRGVHRGAARRGVFAVIESSSNSVHRHARPRPPPIGPPSRGRSGRAPLDAYGYQQPAIAGNAGTPMRASSPSDRLCRRVEGVAVRRMKNGFHARASSPSDRFCRRVEGVAVRTMTNS